MSEVRAVVRREECVGGHDAQLCQLAALQPFHARLVERYQSCGQRQPNDFIDGLVAGGLEANGRDVARLPDVFALSLDRPAVRRQHVGRSAHSGVAQAPLTSAVPA